MASHLQTINRLFVPLDCLCQPSALLVGEFDESLGISCVTGVLNAAKGKEYFMLHGKLDEQILGSWSNPSHPNSEDLPLDVHLFTNTSVLFNLGIDTSSNLPTCHIQLIETISGTGEGKMDIPKKEGIVILFDAKPILRSFFLLDKQANSPCNAKENVTFLTKICISSTLKNSKKPLLTKLIINQQKSQIVHYTKACFWNLIGAIIFIISHSLTSRFFNNRLFKVLFNFPAVMLQLKYRFSDIKNAHYLVSNSTVTSDYTLTLLRFKNSVSRHVMDIILGLLVMFFIQSSSCSETIAQNVMMWADHVVGELQILLQWMMGVPAGLKLNSNLDNMLGRFFLYHIHLWTGYLQVLRPILGSMLWYTSLMGIFGLTVQLSLAQDLISMMTLHIYCFYVYATRLYNVQVNALASLWRLFRGKKWNVLRQRVDSASYDVDQLFVGTLLFTILLFLLPTTALYYSVFMVIRVIVISIQGFIYKIVHILNEVPIYSLLIRVFFPDEVSNNVSYKIVTSHPGDCLFLSMKLQPAGLGFIWMVSTDKKPSETLKWSQFINKLILGHLVYPWIELHNDNFHNDKKNN